MKYSSILTYINTVAVSRMKMYCTEMALFRGGWRGLMNLPVSERRRVETRSSSDVRTHVLVAPQELRLDNHCLKLVLVTVPLAGRLLSPRSGHMGRRLGPSTPPPHVQRSPEAASDRSQGRWLGY